MTGLIVLPLDAGLIHDMACKVDQLSTKEEPNRHYRQSGFSECSREECVKLRKTKLTIRLKTLVC